MNSTAELTLGDNMDFMGLVAILVVVFSGIAQAATPAETHSFHILGKVIYRCYAGYDGKKVSDEVTKRPCDNKTYEKTVIDRDISIAIKDEPDPEDSKELAGSWDEKFDFQGRKFKIAMTLFKKPSPSLYRVRLVGEDDELSSRKTAIFSEMKNLPEMNPISIDYSSVGKKEEIQFSVEVKYSPKK